MSSTFVRASLVGGIWIQVWHVANNESWPSYRLLVVARPVDQAVAASDFMNYAWFLVVRPVDQAVAVRDFMNYAWFSVARPGLVPG